MRVASPRTTAPRPVAPWRAGVGDVRVGDVGPAGLVLDPDRVAAQVHGLDEGGADPAHRVADQIPGVGVGADGVGGDRGQHPGRVRGRLRAGTGRVAATGRESARSPTPTAAGLRGRRRAGGSCRWSVIAATAGCGEHDDVGRGRRDAGAGRRRSRRGRRRWRGTTNSSPATSARTATMCCRYRSPATCAAATRRRILAAVWRRAATNATQPPGRSIVIAAVIRSASRSSLAGSVVQGPGGDEQARCRAAPLRRGGAGCRSMVPAGRSGSRRSSPNHSVISGGSAPAATPPYLGRASAIGRRLGSWRRSMVPVPVKLARHVVCGHRRRRARRGRGAGQVDDGVAGFGVAGQQPVGQPLGDRGRVVAGGGAPDA